MRALLARTAACVTLLAFARVAGSQSADQFHISVDLNFVVLPTTVLDHNGLPVADLPEQSFEVYENGVKQSLRLFRHEDLPVTVGLVVDHSGSMSHKLPDVIAAARTFAELSSPKDEMFVVNFNDDVTLGLPPAIPFTDRADQLAAAIAATFTTGRTALYDAILLAQRHLGAGSNEKKVLVVISDGGDNISRHPMAEVLKSAGQLTAVIYTVGIFDDDDEDKNPAVLKKLAESTGGAAYFPAQTEEVVSVCAAIARDIRSQYTLGYASSTPAKPGAHRSIRVVARNAAGEKLTARARSGYITADAR